MTAVLATPTDSINTLPPAGIYQSPAYRAPRLPSDATFEASKHLCFEEPTRRYSMAEYHLEGQGIAPIGASEPFPLLTYDACLELRKDILSDAVLKDYAVSSHLSDMQAREFNSKVAPFTCALWSSPEVTAAVSKAAGIELVPIMTLELGHTNYSTASGASVSAVRKLNYPQPSAPYPAIPAEERARLEEEANSGKQVVGWHFDSYPFVCVAMLSDVSTMVGGETALQCGDGSIRKVRGPGIGNAVVLQGRHIKHLACKSANAPERITMVTSYRAKCPMTRDASVLKTIRFISQEDRLNYQWSLYRTKLLAERFDSFAKSLEQKRLSLTQQADEFPPVVSREEMKKFAEEQIEYLRTTFEEMM